MRFQHHPLKPINLVLGLKKQFILNSYYLYIVAGTTTCIHLLALTRALYNLLNSLPASTLISSILFFIIQQPKLLFQNINWNMSLPFQNPFKFFTALRMKFQLLLRTSGPRKNLLLPTSLVSCIPTSILLFPQVYLCTVITL